VLYVILKGFLSLFSKKNGTPVVRELPPPEAAH